MIEAVKNDAWAISYASDELRKDIDVALCAVNQNGMVLQIINLDDFKDESEDKQIVMDAVKNSGRALVYAKEFRKDKDVVMAAVTQCGAALEYADKKYCDDEEVVLAAVESWGEEVLIYASDILKENPEFMKKVQSPVAENEHKEEDKNITEEPVEVEDKIQEKLNPEEETEKEEVESVEDSIKEANNDNLPEVMEKQRFSKIKSFFASLRKLFAKKEEMLNEQEETIQPKDIEEVTEVTTDTTNELDFGDLVYEGFEEIETLPKKSKEEQSKNIR